MSAWLVVLVVGGLWLVAAVAAGMAGGFDLIRHVELTKADKTPRYWLVLVVIYPMILVRAAILAFWQTMIGGAR
jgi:hypothetical protein